jgi:putative transposase
MPRRPRFLLTDLPLHVVQRGNDRRQCFFCEHDFQFYLRALGQASAHYRVLVHAYVLMTNHVHLLVTPLCVGAVAKLMQSVGTRYVKHVNATRERTGTLWEGRYKACLVARDQHVLAVCRYIDLNPVRAGMVRVPSEYPWSSYAVLAGLRSEPLVTRHDALTELGTPFGSAYARWCAEANPPDELDRLREATQRELAFGSDGFKSQIETTTARATFVRPPGRRPSCDDGAM